MASVTIPKGVFGRADARRAARGPATARAVILTVSAILAVALVFATITPLRAVTRAEGAFVPVGHPREIQHRGGGILTAVRVREGDHVDAGTILAELDDPDLRREIADTRAALEIAQLRSATLRALSRSAGSGDVLRHPSGPARAALSVDPDRAAINRDAAAYAEARGQLRAARESLGRDALVQLDRTIASLEAARTIAAQRAEAFAARMARLEALAEQGHVSAMRLDEERARMDEIRGDLARADVDLARTRAERAERAAGNAESAVAFREDILLELLDLAAEQRRLTSTLRSLESEAGRLFLKAPEAGTIQAAMHPVPGEVVPPGETMFTLVPKDATLVAEIRIPPGDIGHVRVGDTALLKLRTYDFRRHGGAEGLITTISPSQVTDPDGTKYFRATITPDRPHIGTGEARRPLTAGLDVTAEIVTESRTLLQYLFKPVDQALGRALSER